jgi:hypothetical protein
MASIFTVENERRELHLARVYAATHDGLLPTDHFWLTVEHRFDHALTTGHLARFRFYHPTITPLLLRDYQIRHRPVAPVAPPPALGPVTVPVVVTPPAPPGAVSEPTSGLLWALGLAAVLLAGRVRQWRRGT